MELTEKMANTRIRSQAISFANYTSENEMQRFLGIVQEVPRVRSHFDLLCWLQGDFQNCLPHEIMLAAWGMHKRSSVHVDVVSHLPGVRTTALDKTVKPFMRELFARWQEGGCAPFRVDTTEGFLLDVNASDFGAHAFHEMRTAVVHAIRDERSQHFCIYAALSSTGTTATALQKMEVLIPFMDGAFRQVPSLPEQCDPVEDSFGVLELSDLSEREAEIMKWVRCGKTNQEIGLILNISAFTVKNHLQRIFRKLNVTNRAQAVARLRVDHASAAVTPAK